MDNSTRDEFQKVWRKIEMFEENGLKLDRLAIQLEGLLTQLRAAKHWIATLVMLTFVALVGAAFNHFIH